jgi:plasmid maintenance system killer protein
MILSFKDKRTELFAKGAFVRAFQGFDRQGWKRLEILDAAVSLADLAGLPSNRLEPLRGPGNIRSASINNGEYVSSGPSQQKVRQT